MADRPFGDGFRDGVLTGLLQDFGITWGQLHALADAYYPNGDERLMPPLDPVAAGRLRHAVRTLADAVEPPTDKGPTP
jgi:hypothetical protein